jgi:hypothetical protein
MGFAALAILPAPPALPDPCLPMREDPLVRQHGFTPTAMSLRVEASCQELHTTGSCAKRGSRKG